MCGFKVNIFLFLCVPHPWIFVYTQTCQRQTTVNMRLTAQAIPAVKYFCAPSCTLGRFWNLVTNVTEVEYFIYIRKQKCNTSDTCKHFYHYDNILTIALKGEKKKKRETTLDRSIFISRMYSLCHSLINHLCSQWGDHALPFILQTCSVLYFWQTTNGAPHTHIAISCYISLLWSYTL